VKVALHWNVACTTAPSVESDRIQELEAFAGLHWRREGNHMAVGRHMLGTHAWFFPGILLRRTTTHSDQEKKLYFTDHHKA
jgi:hypothetical protein